MRIAIALLLVGALLAGCADASSKDGTDGDGDIPPVDASDTQGGIRGIVVDQAIVPLAGVLVRVTGEGEVTTDATGSFVFNALDPGDYFVSASKPGYESAQQTATVVAGVPDPPLVKIQLIQIPGADPYFEVYKLEGFYECGFHAIFITDGCDFAYRTAWDAYNESQGSPPPGNPPRTIQQFSNTQYIDIGEKAQTIIQEAFWDDPAVEEMMVSVDETPIDNACDCSPSYFGTTGPAPTYARIDAGEESNSNLGGGQRVAARGFLPFAGVGYALNFEFTIITTVFYSYQPHEGWNFVENGQQQPA
jgi:hypothetical protein